MVSPIAVGSIDPMTEVKDQEVMQEDDLSDLPDLTIGKKRGRPRKEESPQEAVEILTTLSTMSDAIKNLVEATGLISERLNKVESYTESMRPVESPHPEDQETKPATPGKEELLVNAVRRILGQGSIENCQFEVSTVPNKTGRNFDLLIVPPTHLREIPDEVNDRGEKVIMDHRTKVLSYNEGLSGAEDYARRVFDRCVKWANQNAISFFEKDVK